MSAPAYRALRTHGRFAYSPITQRQPFRWPEGDGLAVYIGFNVEHFAFGEGLGPTIGPVMPEPDVLNYAWRDYALRVGAWRCIDLFDELALPTAAIINTSLYDHCPELVAAFAARGDELVAHGHTNSERQGTLAEEDERRLIVSCRERIAEESAQRPDGWLSPWLSESLVTSDLIAEAGYRYTLNWCHDDQPTRIATRGGQPLWAIPYPEEVNDIPMILARQMDASAFADLIVDNFEEMRRHATRQPLVMGIALHAYLMGQPYRLAHLRRALTHIARARDEGRIWITTPGAIASHMDALGR
ncbi:MAG TPA: polysaccharide deacetylase family protein [Paraburkholderia sp.]|jgi:peptidoglycan/xylan/chitin deacetylase (PgdA/CDA1 family)|nr:polysaccharide deacetylase family protein [Paraburkholderia sp.]